jgi:dinuclear metal center YbgI/SA1388 family protein
MSRGSSLGQNRSLVADVASRDEIIRFCDGLLDSGAFEDYGPNGLQVPGRRDVAQVASGVSANLDLIEAAVEGGADLLLVHHGLFWGSAPSALSELLATRLRAALGGELSVAAYHLPLDAHPRIGNNALLREGLGLDPDPVSFGAVKGRAIGAVGRVDGGIAAAELVTRIAELCGREPIVFDHGPERVERVGIVTGGGGATLTEAIELGLDALVTGELSEPAPAEAREGEIHLIAAGHHATETFGIRRLGALVGERFGVAHEFIEVPNPI